MQKKVWWAIIGLAVIVALALLAQGMSPSTDDADTQATSTPGTGTPRVPGATTGTTTPTTNALAVSTQKPGSIVNVGLVSLTQPGFVVIRSAIHNGTVDSAGAVIASSPLLTKGLRTDLTISATTSPSSVYFAELHLDNGNKTFNINEDLVARDPGGNAIVVRFSASAPVTSSPKSYTVGMKSLAFAPAILTVKRGDLVLFNNDDSTIHTVTAAAFGGRNVVNIGKSITIDTGNLAKGTYNYVCDFHAAMTGKLIVQ